MPLVLALFGIAMVAVVAGLASPAPAKPRRPKRPPDLGLTLDGELDADPIGTLVRYGSAADLTAQGFGDEIRGLGYRE